MCCFSMCSWRAQDGGVTHGHGVQHAIHGGAKVELAHKVLSTQICK